MDQNERANLRKNLSELSAKAGGSLVKSIVKSKLSDVGTVLFVGLGGLGSKTVNQIKKIYCTEFEASEKIDFLAVDTATKDLTEITVGADDGYMELDEEFEIFDNRSIHLLENPPEEVKGWLGGIKPRPIDNTGAQQTRQIGRVMLCGTEKYTALKTTIKNKIARLRLADSAPEHPTQVVLVAGISGGTGSGTFIDVAYMIRDILKEYDDLDITTKVWGCFYTPDVQKRIPKIANDPSTWANLQRNGYAALKELDYFMTNGSHEVGAPSVYNLVAPGGVNVSSYKPIFDEGCAFIVTPNTANVDVTDIVAATARSLIYMHQDISMVAGEKQSILSTYSNATANIPTWLIQHAGELTDQSKSIDPAGIENTEFPVFMNYRYSSFGYNSVYFPRDEMMAYCANLVMEKLFAQWKSLDKLNQDNVAAFASEHNIATIDQIAAAIKSTMNIMGYKEEELRIDKVRHANYWPKVIGGGILGKVSETSRTMECAQLNARDVFERFNTQEAYNKMVNNLADGVINVLNSAGFMQANGPFCCIAILTGYGDIMGCCGNLDVLRGKVQQAQVESNKRLDDVRLAMENEAARLEKDHNPTGEEIETFITRCQEYSVALIENAIYTTFLLPVINGVQDKLRSYNNETFEIFVPVMETLMSMLEEDSTIFVQADHKYFAGGQSFGMDAYGVLESQAKRQQFEAVLGAGIDDEEAWSVAGAFAKSMFDPESRSRWQAFKDNPKALAAEIRTIFTSFFTPYVNNLLEKFMVLAYGGVFSPQMSAEELNKIWNADAGTTEAAVRDSAIVAAAQQIVSQLQNGSAVLMNYENGYGVVNELARTSMVMLLSGTRRLNDAIIQLMPAGTSVGYIDESCKSVITSITYTMPVALPLVKGMKNFAQEYYTSAKNNDTASGRHLDEKRQNWVEYLPELYGVDAEHYYKVNKGRADLTITYPIANNDERMYEIIKEAAEFGLKMGYIIEERTTAGVVVGYKLLNITKNEDNYETLFGEYEKMLEKREGSDWKTALERAAMTGRLEYDFVSIECDNSVLQTRIAVAPLLPAGLKNLYRVIRSSMELTRLVLEAKEKYELLFDRLTNMKVYAERVSTFTSMLLYGIIKHDELGKIWSYTYSENSPEMKLFDYAGRRNELDLVSNMYHAFVTFCREVNDEMHGVLCTYIERLDRTGKIDFAKRDERVIEIRNNLSHVLFTDPYRSAANEKINGYRNSSIFRDLYDMPVKFDGDASVYNNITGFYEKVARSLEEVK